MLEPFLRAGVMIVVIIVLTRIQGLRSFSKMSIFDFALTIATGSLIATAIIDDTLDIWIAIAALAAIFAFQATIAWFRVKSEKVRKLVDNTPLLLMRDGEVYRDSLEKARVTEADLFAKLREANVIHTDQVVAVILETTGDISVLHSNQQKTIADCNVFDGIRGLENQVK